MRKAWRRRPTVAVSVSTPSNGPDWLGFKATAPLPLVRSFGMRGRSGASATVTPAISANIPQSRQRLTAWNHSWIRLLSRRSEFPRLSDRLPQFGSEAFQREP